MIRNLVLIAFATLTISGAYTLLSPASAKTMDIVETATAAGSFTTLLAAADAAGLVDALKSDGPLTVFAPSDDAFAKLPEGTVAELLKPENQSKLQAVLKYHVVSGAVMSDAAIKLDSAATLLGQDLAISPRSDGLYIDDAKVVAADIVAGNGVIHVIDNVLIPADIVSVAAAAGSFNTLAAALEAAGLVDTLSNGGPFTVFAPTDEAFAALPEGVVEDLLKPENIEDLRAVLTYHVVPGAYNADMVVNWSEVPTVNGAPIWINASDSGVTASGANVVATDIQALNGVIHVIDAVMLPGNGDATAKPSAGCSH